MAFYRGPNIVTDGLVFAVDAGSTRSYPNPGTGTTVNSLAGYKQYSLINTGTLTNGVGFSSANGGNWTFDGIDDFILYSSTQNVGTVFTVNFWIKPNGKARQTIISNGYPYQTNKGFLIACPGNTTNSNSFFLSLGRDDNYVTAANNSLTQGVWQMVTCRVNGGSNLMKLYVNSIETSYANQPNGNSVLEYNVGDLLTGYRDEFYVPDYLESPVACIQMYNIALTAAQITQNFNAQKSRFGL
jgi:hypothetical protein